MTKKPSATTTGQSDPGTGKTDFSGAPVNAVLSAEQKIGLYRMMLRIRRFEERSLRAYQAKKIGGFLHLYIGQEAVAVGCCSLMGKDDHVITAYRDHGHAIAVGMEMNPLMAELYGKVTGCSKGKGGSMHFFDPSRNYWGGHGIVGGQVPLGVGLAYGAQVQGPQGGLHDLHGGRRRQPGRRPRGLQPRRPLGAARRVRDREQRLFDGHEPGPLLRRGAFAAGRGLRDGVG